MAESRAAVKGSDQDYGRLSMLPRLVIAVADDRSGIAGRRAGERDSALRRVSSPVLVGRESELAELLEAVTQPPALALLEGEAGIGKTRLVAELLARPEVARRQRLVGGCQQVSEPFLLGPLVEALREASFAPASLSAVAGALRPLLPELANRLPELPPPLGDRRAERHRLFRALRELLGALGPTVLVLEDLHWADATTVEVLRFLAPQPPPELTLVCTYRREDLPAGSPLLGLTAGLPREARGVVLPLETLDRQGVRDLVARIMDVEDVSVEFVAQLSEDSGGLPFAVEEILRLLRERRDVIRQRGVWVRAEMEEIRLPVALRDAVLERVGRLSPRTQRLVEAAAVLADSDEVVLLETAELDGAPAERALAEALSSALLLELDEGRYGFRHVLARQAIVDALAPPARRRLHLRAAASLERVQPTPHARLAHHYKEAGKTKQWIQHAEHSADRAESLEDDATAYRFLKEAVVVPELSATTKSRLAIKLANHARNCLAHGEAIDILGVLLEDERLSRRTRGELRMWLVRLLVLEGRPEEAYAETVRAVDELSRRPAAAAEAMLFRSWVESGPIGKQLGWLDRALRTAVRSKDRALMISVAGHRAQVLLLAGDRLGLPAIDEIPQPGPVEEELDRAARAYNNLADALLHVGYLERADVFLRRSRGVLNRMVHPPPDFAQRITELQLRWLVGDWVNLEEQARRCLDDWEDLGQLRADPEAVLGLLLLAQGRVRASSRLLEPLADEFLGEATVLAWVASGLARLRLAEDRSEVAIEKTARAFEIIERKGVWAWATDVAPVTVKAFLGAGRTTDAAELTRRFAAGLRGREAPAASAGLMVCRALLDEAGGEPDRAARRFLAAERAWRALPRPYEAARAREAAGRCMLPHHKERGCQLSTEAMEAFHALGATWDAIRVRQLLQEHGVISPHRRGRKSYRGELSPREAEVAALASEGLSNREIALTLFLSQKTVEGHLRSTMRKLGVSSRSELPERLENGAEAMDTEPVLVHNND
jgi:DNA-binding CsgD family transcriptional regulator